MRDRKPSNARRKPYGRRCAPTIRCGASPGGWSASPEKTTSFSRKMIEGLGAGSPTFVTCGKSPAGPSRPPGRLRPRPRPATPVRRGLGTL